MPNFRCGATVFNTKTSWRCSSLDETLRVLEKGMIQYGVTRITDTTRLDKIGIPVFAAIRPHAGEGSITVTSGKSVHEMAAKVGALAEAYELACAKLDPDVDRVSQLTWREFEDKCGFPAWALHIQAACIATMRPVSPTAKFSVVQCDLLGEARQGLLPASLVYFPYHSAMGLDVHGLSTNGLASGNSEDEAIVHALFEVIERDAVSFASIGRPTHPVTGLHGPEIESILYALDCSDADLQVVYCKNEFDLPTFTAYVLDRQDSSTPVFVGHGTHLSKDIALIRACTEAIQSRLTHIHGARDDIIDFHRQWSGIAWNEKRARVNSLRVKNARGTQVSFAEIPTIDKVESLADALFIVKSRLAKQGFEKICVYRYRRLVPNFCAVRVVVPGLEFYTTNRMRIGERLLAYAKSRA
ncbi:YcaO-like family protein [Paraburkholderia nemoris]|uniref:YcaO-like family protein n=1 Tax=Paraburkholderia nemoris TaxID=2793076 RepID=UPI0038BDD0EA